MVNMTEFLKEVKLFGQLTKKYAIVTSTKKNLLPQVNKSKIIQLSQLLQTYLLNKNVSHKSVILIRARLNIIQYFQT